jgi:hypothetical protein
MPIERGKYLHVITNPHSRPSHLCSRRMVYVAGHATHRALLPPILR